MSSNKKNALLHFLACVLLIVLGYFGQRANIGMPIIWYILGAFMGFMGLMYWSRKDDF